MQGAFLVSLLLFFSCSVEGLVNSADANFAIGLSTAAMNELVDSVLLPPVDNKVVEIGSHLPQQCCYWDITRDFRFFFENAVIPPSSVVSYGSFTSSPEGLYLDLLIRFNLQMYYKYCEETLLGCMPLFFCEGNIDLEVDLSVKFMTSFSGGPNGEVVLSFSQFHTDLTIPKKKGLCFSFSSLLDAAIPAMNLIINRVLPEKLNNAVSKYNGFPRTLPFEGPFDLYWTATNATGTSANGLGLQFILDVLIKSLGGKPAPFLPNPPLPPILKLLNQNSVALDCTDSFINNILYSIFLDKLPSFETESDGWKLSLKVESSPQVYFQEPTSSDDGADIVIKLKTIAAKKLLRFTVNTVITSHFELVVTPQGEVYLDLDPEEFIVEITSIVPPVTNSTKNFLDKKIEEGWASMVPGIDEVLKAHPFQLPHIANFKNPSVTYHNGYAYLSFDTIPSQAPTPGSDFMTDIATDLITNVTMETLLDTWGNRYDNSPRCPDVHIIGYKLCGT